MLFWRKRKVLITGHTGFKGSWLSLWLQLLDADLLGYSLASPSIPNLFTLATVSHGMTSVIGDIRDYSFLQQTVQAFQPEIIFHLAAQPLVRYSYQEPIETYATNVMGTVNLLEAARSAQSVKAIINVTTDKCYENKEWQRGYHEQDMLGGYDPYSNSKACSELVTSAYRTSYFNERNIGLASARAGNVIGGGDWAVDRIIPDIIRAFMNHEPVLIRNPNAERPWQHVLESLSGYLLLAEKLYHSQVGYSESWNFGPSEFDIKPVSWIVEKMIQVWGEGVSWKPDSKTNPHEATYLKLDCRKANDQLGWRPRWHLEKSLEETIKWYRAYHAGKNMREVTLSQIKNFTKEKNNLNGVLV